MIAQTGTSLLLLIALHVVSRISFAVQLNFEMQPTGEFEAANDYAGLMFFKVVEPATENQTCDTSCSSCSNPGVGWAEQTKCGGEVSLDLSAHSELKISFNVPTGYEVEIDGPERSRIEFQAKVPCGPPGGDAYVHQQVEGSGFTPTLRGTNASSLVYNADASFVELGRCMGCEQCEVYTRVQFDGPIDKVRVSEISWTVQYDANNTVAGPQVYRYGTETYCWIRGATLVSRRLQEHGIDESGASRQLGNYKDGQFKYNVYKLVKIEPTADSSTKNIVLCGYAVSFVAAVVAGLQW